MGSVLERNYPQLGLKGLYYTKNSGLRSRNGEVSPIPVPGLDPAGLQKTPKRSLKLE